MMKIMADEQIHSAHIIVQVALKKVILLHALYRYTTTPNMVIIVTAMDTHGSWHISFASFVSGISKADIVSIAGSLCRAIAVTSVHNFLCLKARYS